MKSAGFLLSLVALVIFAFGMVPCMGWLMIPAFPVTVVVLAFNFMGDGLRDAADPYGSGGGSE